MKRKFNVDKYDVVTVGCYSCRDRRSYCSLMRKRYRATTQRCVWCQSILKLVERVYPDGSVIPVSEEAKQLLLEVKDIHGKEE